MNMIEHGGWKKEDRGWRVEGMMRELDGREGGRQVIFHHGNHHHKPSCPFYTDFAERSPTLVPHCPQCKAVRPS